MGLENFYEFAPSRLAKDRQYKNFLYFHSSFASSSCYSSSSPSFSPYSSSSSSSSSSFFHFFFLSSHFSFFFFFSFTFYFLLLFFRQLVKRRIYTELFCSSINLSAKPPPPLLHSPIYYIHSPTRLPFTSCCFLQL